MMESCRFNFLFLDPRRRSQITSAVRHSFSTNRRVYSWAGSELVIHGYYMMIKNFFLGIESKACWVAGIEDLKAVERQSNSVISVYIQNLMIQVALIQSNSRNKKYLENHFPWGVVDAARRRVHKFHSSPCLMKSVALNDTSNFSLRLETALWKSDDKPIFHPPDHHMWQR